MCEAVRSISSTTRKERWKEGRKEGRRRKEKEKKLKALS
jgi:hypothetical protein